jgi:hypothetical protein
MDTHTILASTLTLFGLMILLAAVVFATLIWLVMRRARTDLPPQAAPPAGTSARESP